MPPVARLGSGIPLVARGREMRRLRAALDRAGTGAAGAVLIAGDAGVGKTRLVGELTAQATEAGVRVLTGRCLDVGETGLPYLPFAEALSQISGDGLAAVRARPALGRLLPELAVPAATDPTREAPGAATPLGGRRTEQDVGQLQLFDAVHGLLGELSEQHPLLLIVEDLHWADDSTRYLLSFLVSRLRAQKLLLVATYRTDDLHRRHPLRPLLGDLARLPTVERLDLTPFSRSDAQAFVAALADNRMPEHQVREVAKRSEGNPFFAEELLAAYVDCADCPDEQLPAALADLMLARTERLSPAAQQVVRVASVWGRRLKHERLRAVSGLPDPDLDEALREIVQHNVLVVEDQDVYQFRHALLREAVYGDLLPGERVRLHAAYATYLTDELARGVRGAAAGLAHHSLESHALPQALAASVRAAEEAKKLGAPAEALKHLERALKLWAAVPAEERPEITELALLRKASWTAGTAGQPERAIAFARAAVDQLTDPPADPELAAELWRRLAQALTVLDGADDQKIAAMQRAWELVRDRPASPVRAWVLAVRASVLRHAGDLAEARRCALQAVADDRATGGGGAEADALATLGLLDERLGQVDSARAHLTNAIRCAVEVDAPNAELRARYFVGFTHFDQGELAEAARAFDEGAARARDLGMQWSAYGLELRVMQAVTKYALGDWDGSEAAAEPPGRRVSNTVSARLAAAGVSVTVSRGRFAEAERLLTELRTDWHRDVQIALYAGGCGAELALWRGRPAQAVERVTEALDWLRRADDAWTLACIRIAALGIAAHAELAARAVTRRDPAGQQTAVAEGEQLAQLARQTVRHGTPRTGTLGPEGRAWLARAEAELTRLRGASDPAAWAAAVRAFDFGAVYEQAVCRWRLGEALLAAENRGADRRGEAAVELRAAEQVADSLGAAPLRDAVRQLARRARVTLQADAEPEPPARDVLDPFTPRERAVLGLVAMGRTNRQVGDELYISEKTVSVHLSRIMAKLGASRRAEAVAVAYERGLLDQPR